MNLNKLSIQEFLSLAYVYLLILGVISDTIFYSFFGLHVIAHSDVLDILLSPISILTENLIIPIFIIIGCVFMYFIRVKISPKMHEKNKKKESYRLKKNFEKLEHQYSKKPTITEFVPLFALVVFSMFVGLRIGHGFKLKDRMINKDFSYLDTITFQNNEKVNTTIIGQNSLYVFYVEEGDDKLSIAPITQSIRLITKRKENETFTKNKVESNSSTMKTIEKDSTNSLIK